MTITDMARFPRWRMAGGAFATALRYGISAAGPVAVSGAHFLASLIFLRNLPAHEFGLFSFVMVVVSFGMSLNVSLITVPITRNLVTGETGVRPICFQMNWLVCVAFAALLFTALVLGGAPLLEAAMLGLFGGVFTYRWFSRCFAFVDNRMSAAIRSDFVYSIVLVAGLGLLAFTHHIDFTSGSQMLLAAALVALI